MDDMLISNDKIKHNRPIMISGEVLNQENDDNFLNHKKLTQRNQNLKNYADAIKRSNKAKRKYLFRMLKTSNPNISLKSFCREYMNSSHFDEAETVDNWFGSRLLKKAKKRYKRGRNRIKKGFKKIGGKLKKVANKLKKSLLSSALLPILPLKGLMVTAIKKKTGQNMRKSFLIDVATTFYNKVVKKGNNFDEISTSDLENSVLNQYYTVDEFDRAHYEGAYKDHIAPAVVTVIVTSIVSFIKAMKKKRDDDKAQNKESHPIVDTIGKGVNTVLNEIQKSTPTEIIVAKTGADATVDTGNRVTKNTTTQKSNKNIYIVSAGLLIGGFLLSGGLKK